MLEGVSLPPRDGHHLPWGAGAMRDYEQVPHIGTFGSMISEHDSTARWWRAPRRASPDLLQAGPRDMER